MFQDNTTSNAGNVATTTQTVQYPTAVHEIVRPTTTTIVQPVIHRTIEQTEIHQIRQPIYEKIASQPQYPDTITSQGVRQPSLISSSSSPAVFQAPSQTQFFTPAPSQAHYTQPAACTCIPQQQTLLPAAGRGRGFGKKAGSRGSATSQTSVANPNIDPSFVGAPDVTYHSYRWAHRDKQLAKNTNATTQPAGFNHGPLCPISQAALATPPLIQTQTVTTPPSDQQFMSQPGFSQSQIQPGYGPQTTQTAQTSFSQPGFSQSQIQPGYGPQTAQTSQTSFAQPGFSQSQTQPGYGPQTTQTGQTSFAQPGLAPASSSMGYPPSQTAFY